MKGGGDDDDDDDDDDDKRRRRDDDDDKKKDVCKMMPWNPPVINFNSSSKAKIKFCDQKKFHSCHLVAVRYQGVGDWQNISDFKQTFRALKTGQDIFFQVNCNYRL